MCGLKTNRSTLSCGKAAMAVTLAEHESQLANQSP